ncbi:hypothetical protein HDU91_001036 [Kappamyces sp. JEL0680]|nr:hypothetical protein HDU91_001036 [Kappamyces sp. JEL0680]
MLPIKIPTAKTDATVQPAQPPDLDLSARRIPKSVHVQVSTCHAAKDHHSSALAQELRNRKALRKTPLQRTPSGTPQKPKHIFHSDPMMESFQRRMLAIRRAESPDDAAEPAEDGKDSACKECQGSEMHGGYREADRDEETEVEDSSEDDAPTPKRRVSIEDASDGFDVNELNRMYVRPRAALQWDKCLGNRIKKTQLQGIHRGLASKTEEGAPVVAPLPLPPRLEQHYQSVLYHDLMLLCYQHNPNALQELEKSPEWSKSSPSLATLFSTPLHALDTRPEHSSSAHTGWITPPPPKPVQEKGVFKRVVKNPIDYTSVPKHILQAPPEAPPPAAYSPLPSRMPRLQGVELEVYTEEAIGNK